MSVRNMKSVRSYEDCLRIIENFHANHRRRSWRPSAAPLDQARSEHIFAEHAHGEVRCTLYETDLVTYMPGRQVRIKPHTSNMSMQFYDATLPPGLRAKRVGYYLYILAELFFDDLVAKFDAFITNVDTRASYELPHLVLRLAAE